jgi:hypothetical protein
MKPVITKIEIDKETREELDAILKIHFKHRRITEVRRLVGGFCVSCGGIPSTRVSYQVGDKEQPASKLEYYCNSCLGKSGIGTTPKVTKLLDTPGKNVTYAEREENSQDRA